MKPSSFKIKTWGGFNLNYPQGNKFNTIEWKFYNIFSPKSKVTSYSTYSRDCTQFRIHRLFYMNLLHTGTHVCDLEIPLKGFDHR